MRLSELAKELRSIAQRGGGFGSEVERELLSLAEILDLRADLDVSGLKRLIKPKAVRTKKSVKFDDQPQGIVRDYLVRLREGKSSAECLRVLSALTSDPAVKRPELYEIAGRFAGARLSFKNRGEAEASIRSNITRRDWDEGALKIIRSRADGR